MSFTQHPNAEATPKATGPRIVIPGNPQFAELDFYCHRQLGGCGCVFFATKSDFVERFDSDNDVIAHYVICPTCKSHIDVRQTCNPKGLQYRPISAYKQ